MLTAWDGTEAPCAVVSSRSYLREQYCSVSVEVVLFLFCFFFFYTGMSNNLELTDG